MPKRVGSILYKSSGWLQTPRSGFESAQWMLREQESLTLTADDIRAFLAALGAPREPSPALQRAFARHAEKVDGPLSFGDTHRP
jgi:uncharacterized protein DUF1778